MVGARRQRLEGVVEEQLVDRRELRAAGLQRLLRHHAAEAGGDGAQLAAAGLSEGGDDGGGEGGGGVRGARQLEELRGVLGVPRAGKTRVGVDEAVEREDGGVERQSMIALPEVGEKKLAWSRVGLVEGAEVEGQRLLDLRTPAEGLVGREAGEKQPEKRTSTCRRW